jgi:hypothetical protein
MSVRTTAATLENVCQLCYNSPLRLVLSFLLVAILYCFHFFQELKNVW